MMNVTIVGAGISGISCALALTKWMPETPNITILELRPHPSTMGGAIGLTPNAVRALYRLGVLDHINNQQFGAYIDSIQLFNVYSAAELGQISFSGSDGEGVGDPKFKGLRILRSDLLKALMQTVQSLNNVEIKFGCKITRIEETSDAVELGFDDGSRSHCDFLVGADGIHSMVRNLLVEPGRVPEYTGIAGVSGFSTISPQATVGWKDTALCQSTRGSLLCSSFEHTRTKQFLGAVMETEDVQSKEGWHAVGKEQEQLKQRIRNAYLGNGIKMRGVSALVEGSHDWSLWPVYSLPAGGRWHTQGAILIGDAAHAMPPQGESAGIALEDSIVLGRVLSVAGEGGLPGRFVAYERLRRPRAEEAYAQATWGWKTQKDSGRLLFQFRSWITWIFLTWTTKSRLAHHSEDLATKELDLS